MNYSDNLPRKVKTEITCSALYEDGKICRKHSQYEITIHKDTSLEPNCPLKWARIFVCEEHLPSFEKSEINKKLT